MFSVGCEEEKAPDPFIHPVIVVPTLNFVLCGSLKFRKIDELLYYQSNVREKGSDIAPVRVVPSTVRRLVSNLLQLRHGLPAVPTQIPSGLLKALVD